MHNWGTGQRPHGGSAIHFKTADLWDYYQFGDWVNGVVWAPWRGGPS